MSNEKKSTYLKDLDLALPLTSYVIMTGHFISSCLFPHTQNMEVCAFTSGVLRDHIVEILKTSNILSLGSLSKILRAQMLTK